MKNKGQRSSPCGDAFRQQVRGQRFGIKSIGVVMLILSCAILFWSCAQGGANTKEITVIYSGLTHAMLYPCSCPREPDGGIARRATLLKELRSKSPHALVVDSGSFFAGGLMDEYTQNTQMDMERTKVNLKAMELERYDAASIGDDEFNFGKAFLIEQKNTAKVPLISCNLKAEGIPGYVIKEVSGVKVGVIGVTPISAKQKSEGIEIAAPKEAVAKAIKELKEKGAGLIILLGNLGEAEYLSVLNDVAGIDVFIGYSQQAERAPVKVKETIVLSPSWQGRRMDKAVFILKDNKIADFKTESIRLSDKVKDDKDIQSILPRCFSDAGCKKEGLVGTCQNPGTVNSSCIFTEASKVSLLVVTPKACVTCDTEGAIANFKKMLPGLEPKYLYYPESKQAVNLVKDSGILGLPAYFLGREIEKDKKFDSLKANLELKQDMYLFKPEVVGFSFFPLREKKKGKTDLFISLFDNEQGKDPALTLDIVHEFNPVLHFLAVEQEGKFSALKGNLEVEEDLRCVCVQKYYPALFWSYISCRAKNPLTSWWDDCAKDMDTAKIISCAKSEEGKSLLKENISINSDLKIMYGPTFLMDNQEVFTAKGVPSKEDLRKIFKK